MDHIPFYVFYLNCIVLNNKYFHIHYACNNKISIKYECYCITIVYNSFPNKRPHKNFRCFEKSQLTRNSHTF